MSPVFVLVLLLALVACDKAPLELNTRIMVAGPAPVTLLPTTPWDPPETALAPVALEAVDAAFAAWGLHDPRGLPYHRLTMECVVRFRWRGGLRYAYDERYEATETRGWLLPRHPAEPPMAIGWDGQIHEVLDIGAPASVRDDIAAALDDAGHPQFCLGGPHECLTVIHVPLLLRLGEGELADRVWPALRRTPPTEGSGRPHAYTIASSTLDAVTTLAARERLRRRDWRARALLRRAHAAWVAIPTWFDERDLRWGHQPHHYRQLEALLADDMRRTWRSEGEVTRALEAAATHPPERSIAELIALLDEVKTRYLGQDPVVAALEKHGEAIVPALIEVYASDERYTRATGAYGAPLTTRQVAEELLRGSLGQWAAPFDVGSSLDQDVARLRSYWSRWGGDEEHQRWRGTLLDDDARNEWARAVTYLVEAKGDTARAIEAMRPALTPLIARRLAAMPLEDACEVAEPFARWALDESVAALLHLLERMVGDDERPRQECVSQLAMLLHRVGEPTALDLYASWATTVGVDDLADARRWPSLEPLAAFADEPRMRALAKRLFVGPSAWHALITERHDTSWTWSLVAGMPDFLRLLRRELRLCRPIGTLDVSRERVDVITSQGAFTFTATTRFAEGNNPEAVGTFPYRLCDCLARELAGRDELPAFELGWSPEHRDAAIAQMIAGLSARIDAAQRR